VQWSNEKPTADGFYWFKGTLGVNRSHEVKSPTVVHLVDHNVIFYAKSQGEFVFRPMKYSSGEWAGPIEPPTGEASAPA
jgi:hypothetical protein